LDRGEDKLVTADTGKSGGQGAVENDMTLQDTEPFGRDGAEDS
jgi:hypothetical protein